MKVRISGKQASTLLALNSALNQHTDTTCEIACYDNAAPGTGARLLALARKGLCVRGRKWSQRAGFQWSFTPEGSELAYRLKLAYERDRGYWRQKHGGNALRDWTPPDQGGEYVVSVSQQGT